MGTALPCLLPPRAGRLAWGLQSLPSVLARGPGENSNASPQLNFIDCFPRQSPTTTQIPDSSRPNRRRRTVAGLFLRAAAAPGSAEKRLANERGSHLPVDVALEEMDVPFLAGGHVGVEVADGDQSTQAAGLVEHRQMADATVPHDTAGLLNRH